MTYIEFFDEDVIENICGCLVSVPDRVILIGDNKKRLEEHTERYHSFFLDRGHDIEFGFRAVNKNSLNGIVDMLSDIVEEYDDCIFDLTGGQELMLVAVGIIWYRYRDMDIQMHRFNLRSNMLYDCDNDGNNISVDALPQVSVEELIRLYGGKVVYESDKPCATIRWEWSQEFMDDIDTIWDICRRDVRAWNTQIGVFAAAEELNDGEDPLVTTVSMPKISDYLKNFSAKYVEINRIIEELQQNGLMLFDDSEEDIVSVTYKNEQIKRLLTKAGQALEMKVTLSAMRAMDKSEDYIYNDVMNGAYIDWDGDIHTEQEGYDTENEIDVLMMHGMIPVFVSCKNGMIDIDELYKLNAVATKFGGKYAKKVLIATALGKDDPFAEHFRQRAKDMNIRLVENIQRTTDDDLERIIGSLWCN